MTNPYPHAPFGRRVLVVGSWAKEQITIENLKEDPNVEALAYMDIENPAIASMADGYRVGSLYDTGDMVEYAKSEEVDLVIVTTASPLSAGLVDALRKEGITAFGPSRMAARLETDKAFTRELLRKHVPGVVPRFGVFDKEQEAIDFARDLGWQVAVKPIGLTEGLGVKVFGEQLRSEDELVDYIGQIMGEKIGGSSRVIVEEKLEGVEFTIQCFVSGNMFIPTPAVQDFKKLLPGEKGLNTASMGSYSDAGDLLPFMRQEDYDAAVEIISRTLAAFASETGRRCQGFLYGQFMLTEDGVKLIEYNFRPGDPEWMNTVIVMDGAILGIIGDLMRGEVRTVKFENQATVCKYIVPKEYPVKLNETLDVRFDEEEIRKEGVRTYYSCGLGDGGKLNVGSERGIAFIAKADTIFEANEKVDRAISAVEGDFYYRYDIGTRELIESKIAHADELRG